MQFSDWSKLFEQRVKRCLLGESTTFIYPQQFDSFEPSFDLDKHQWRGLL